MTLLKAIEAGVDVVDTCLSPLGNGTSQPTTESIVATLQGTERDTGLDLKALTEIAGYFRGVADELTHAVSGGLTGVFAIFYLRQTGGRGHLNHGLPAGQL